MDGQQALDLGASSDFPSLLRRQGLLGPAAQIGPINPRTEIVPTESTTILAFKFSDGVLVAGDRRATSGNTVVYDRADKVLEIDRRSIMAIAGVPATAWEMAAVRGILYYENTWGKKPLQKIGQDEAAVVALRALDTASEADTATGGIDRDAKIFPVMKIVSADGILTLPEEKIAELFHKRVA